MLARPEKVIHRHFSGVAENILTAQWFRAYEVIRFYPIVRLIIKGIVFRMPRE